MVSRIGFLSALITFFEIHVTGLNLQCLLNFCSTRIKNALDYNSLSVWNVLPQIILVAISALVYIIGWSLVAWNTIVEILLGFSILGAIFFGEEGDFRVTYYSADSLSKMFNQQVGDIMPMVRPELKTKLLAIGTMLGIIENHGIVIIAIGSVLYLIECINQVRNKENINFSTLTESLKTVLNFALMIMTVKILYESGQMIPDAYHGALSDWNNYIFFSDFENHEEL